MKLNSIVNLKSNILNFLIVKEKHIIRFFIIAISVYIALILMYLSIPLYNNQIFHIQNTIYDKTIYPDEYYKEELRWTGTIFYPYSEIYLSFQTDRDIYLYVFNEIQYLNYLERKSEDLSISNLECVASQKNLDEGLISLSFDLMINPLYIIIDTNEASSEVEILSLTYRYTILEKSWYFWLLIIFISFLGSVLITFYIKKKYNPWEYFHDRITDNARDKFNNQQYDDAILAVFNEIEPKFIKTIEKKGFGYKYGRKAISLLFNEDQPIIKLADTKTKTGRNIQSNYKDLFSATFALERNRIAHNNIIFKKYEAFRELGILDKLYKILDKARITCECGEDFSFFEYIDDHNH